MSIKVALVTKTNRQPTSLISHAALTCYNPEKPSWSKEIDIKARLWETGHHTTFQHYYLTFFLEGISVGDVTLGLHLANPFYNSSQRSGRFCGGMFAKPNLGQIRRYIKTFWPDISPETLEKIEAYINFGVNIFAGNIAGTTVLAQRFIDQERPFATDKYKEQNGPKIAQEQLRMFIPVIFPTGLLYTVNLSALAAMYRTARTPVMRALTAKMANAVLQKHPELKFLFGSRTEKPDWVMQVIPSSTRVMTNPLLIKHKVFNKEVLVLPEPDDISPVDSLHFDPDFMNNANGGIYTQLALSLATMGQNQRHRTLGRSQPAFTGAFYLPPIPQSLGLKSMALELMARWQEIVALVDPTLAMVLAPYGAMVTYGTWGDFNALIHEHGKRLCWCAQEEIGELSRQLRLAIESYGPSASLLRLFEPPCYRTGKCAEGARYCGRDIAQRKKGDYFPRRQV